ncbi:MAG: DJ-1/PfpI family protein [Anaerolineaceae bacterium]|nr:DJ-1/PfpI family protein [Anaerolineaceae bacterium]MCB9098211.1 DJ-1/PfpI family protein [Anaerolineales bacterium]
MPKTDHGQVILLLADGFEEMAFSILVVTLREAGLAVLVVGLRSGRVNGAHGLMIVPDISMDRLLEKMPAILAVILPGGMGHLGRLQVDPRVGALLGRSVEEKAMLVGLDPHVAELTNHFIGLDQPNVWFVPEPGQSLEPFATMIARRLQDLQEG